MQSASKLLQNRYACLPQRKPNTMAGRSYWLLLLAITNEFSLIPFAPSPVGEGVICANIIISSGMYTSSPQGEEAWEVRVILLHGKLDTKTVHKMGSNIYL